MASKTSSSFYKWDRRSDRFSIFTATRSLACRPTAAQGTPIHCSHMTAPCWHASTQTGRTDNQRWTQLPPSLETPQLLLPPADSQHNSKRFYELRGCVLLSVWQSTLRPGLSQHPSGADPPRHEVSPSRVLRFLCGGS